VAGKMIDDPETVATAIRIGHPQSWDLAWAVQKESGGWFDKFSDEQILAAQKMLSQYEGIFANPLPRLHWQVPCTIFLPEKFLKAAKLFVH